MRATPRRCQVGLTLVQWEHGGEAKWAGRHMGAGASGSRGADGSGCGCQVGIIRPCFLRGILWVWDFHPSALDIRPPLGPGHTAPHLGRCS